MDPRVEIEIARRTLVDGWMSTVRRPGAVWNFDNAPRKEYGEGIFAWNTIPDRILAASPHLQGHDVPGDEIDRLKAQGLTLFEALEELGIG